MSSVVISGDTSGAITLAAPAVSGTNTATLPAATGTVMVSGNMPTFSYYQSASQTLATNTATKLTFTSNNWDTTSGMFASSRFTPTVAGYYVVDGGFEVGTAYTGGECNIYKNGSVFKSGMAVNGGNIANRFAISALVYCNGSTDYIELYGYISIGQATSTGSAYTYFQACMLRTA
jgi:hypothetical protein